MYMLHFACILPVSWAKFGLLPLGRDKKRSIYLSIYIRRDGGFMFTEEIHCMAVDFRLKKYNDMYF